MSTSITSSTLGKKTYKIIFLGDSGTGKTSIIERFVNNQFEEKENVQFLLSASAYHRDRLCRQEHKLQGYYVSPTALGYRRPREVQKFDSFLSERCNLCDFRVRCFK